VEVLTLCQSKVLLPVASYCKVKGTGYAGSAAFGTENQIALCIL